MVNKNLPKAGAVKAPKVTSPNLPLSAVITLTKLGAAGNPKRPNTVAYTLYTLYGKKPITVGAYINAVAKTARPKAGRVAIAWDLARGYIAVK
jgi:hypothetical protein